MKICQELLVSSARNQPLVVAVQSCLVLVRLLLFTLTQMSLLFFAAWYIFELLRDTVHVLTFLLRSVWMLFTCYMILTMPNLCCILLWNWPINAWAVVNTLQVCMKLSWVEMVCSLCITNHNCLHTFYHASSIWSRRRAKPGNVIYFIHCFNQGKYLCPVWNARV